MQSEAKTDKERYETEGKKENKREQEEISVFCAQMTLTQFLQQLPSRGRGHEAALNQQQQAGTGIVQASGTDKVVLRERERQ
jgi:hypothetical protein